MRLRFNEIWLWNGWDSASIFDTAPVIKFGGPALFSLEKRNRTYRTDEKKMNFASVLLLNIIPLPLFYKKEIWRTWEGDQKGLFKCEGVESTFERVGHCSVVAPWLLPIIALPQIEWWSSLELWTHINSIRCRLKLVWKTIIVT